MPPPHAALPPPPLTSAACGAAWTGAAQRGVGDGRGGYGLQLLHEPRDGSREEAAELRRADHLPTCARARVREVCV